MEIRRARGVATFLTYPLKDGNGNLVTGITTLRPQYATFTDGSPVSTISNIAGFCAELGATGIYYSSISASEMANDYIYFIASPTTGAKRFDVLINCTKIASVQAVSDTVTATVSSGTVTGVVNSVGVREGTGGNVLSLTNGRVGINWTDIVNATSTQAFSLTTIATANNVATANFVASVSAAVLNNVGTVTGVTNSVTANVGTVTGVVNSVGVRTGTGGNVFNLSNGRVGINWADIANATSTQALTLTTIASVNNVATTNFCASVSAAVLSNVGTVTGVTNSVSANVGTVTGVTNSVTATGVAEIKAKTDFLPSATAGEVGGVLIAGSNAGTTFATLTVTATTTFTGNVLLSDGLSIATPSTTNRDGLKINGNGDGHGVKLISGIGAASSGLYAISNAVVGHGLYVEGRGTGGTGLFAKGSASSGFGAQINGGAATGTGLQIDGISGVGLEITGPSTGVWIRSDGTAILCNPQVDGYGFAALSAGAGKAAMILSGAGGSGDAHGLHCIAGDTGTPIVGNILGTITGVSNSVTANVGTITGVTNSVNANVATVTGVVNSVSANVGTISGVTNRVDATLTQGAQSMIADRLLFRSLAGGADGGRTVQDAFRLLRNRRGLTFGAMNTATLTAYIEDDATPAWTAIVGTSSAVGLTDVDAS